MISQYLADHIDIHGGGRDLVFPHHESEIAQSESYSGRSPFVKYWMHIGMVMYQGEKMSKSLGNIILIKNLLEKYSPNAIRWMLLSHYYRMPWEYNEAELVDAEEKVKDVLAKKSDGEAEPEFLESLDDDFNTPKALEIIKNSPSPQKMLNILGFII